MASSKKVSEAVLAYLGRSGFEDVSEVSPGLISATDDGLPVLVSYASRSGVTRMQEGDGQVPDKVKAAAISGGYGRVDSVEMLVIAEDRALLRHTRGVPFGSAE